MSLGQLDTNLRRLYAGARNKTVDVYSKSLTLLGFRHKGLKLASDPRFKTSNQNAECDSSRVAAAKIVASCRLEQPTLLRSEVDQAGDNYGTMAHDEFTGNHPGIIAEVSITEKLARMYRRRKRQLQGLAIVQIKPEVRIVFFQYPRKKWSFDDNIWYEGRPVGVNSLHSVMKNVSQAASLSKLHQPQSQGDNLNFVF